MNQQDARLQRISQLLLLCALLLMIGYCVVYVAYAANLIAFPFDYDQGEGFELVDTILFSRFEWPYRDTETFPFYSSNYPPLFHMLAAPFVWGFGPAYWYGRLLGFLSTVLTASAIAFAIYRDGRKRAGKGHLLIAATAGLAYLASNTIYHIGPLFRQHAAMVMFETLAVVILAHANEIQQPAARRRSLAAGLLLAIAAGYTKQLAVVTAATIAIFLLMRNPRRAIVWGSFAAAVGIIIFAWMVISTEGEWWRQAIVANVNELRIDQTLALTRQWFALHGFLLIPAGLVVLYELYFDRISIYAIWFVLSTGINGMFSGAWGAGDSYFATSIAAACLLSGIFAVRTINGGWTFYNSIYTRRLIVPLRRLTPIIARIGLLVIPLLYLGYGRAVLHMPTTGIFAPIAALLNITPNALNGFYDSARTQDGQYATGYANIGHHVTPADHEAGWYMVEQIKSANGLVLSEEAGFVLMAGLGVENVITNPTQLLNLQLKDVQTGRGDLYSGAALVQMINERQFALIILRARFYPTNILIAIDTHYAVNETVAMNGFSYELLRPRVP